MKLRVAYARRRYKNKVYETPLLVTSYRDDNGVSRNKTVFNLSELPSHAIAALEEALRTGHSPKISVDSVKYQFSVPFGDALAVYWLARELGISEALECLTPAQRDMTLAMILNRCSNCAPLSVRATATSWNNTALPLIVNRPRTPKLGYWYDTFTALHIHQNEIEKRLFDRRPVRSNREVFLYDITSSYFEGSHCKLAAYGYNRDKKKGKKQITIGLLTEEDGYPLSIEVFRGNTADQTTVWGQVQKLKERFGANRLIFVGDRGMLTSSRIEEFERGAFGLGIDFITALKRSDMVRLADDPQHPIQLGLFDHKNLAEVVEGNRRYILCCNPQRRKEDQLARQRFLNLTEAKLAGIRKSVENRRLKKKDKVLARLYKWINKWNMERFFTVEVREGFFSYQRNDYLIEHYSKLDGCYVLVTSVNASRMDKHVVYQRYRSLAKVEQEFRQLKSMDLEVRPIRVWTEDHVRGHVFLCSLALRISWEMRFRLVSLLKRDERNHRCEADSLREIWDCLKQFTIGWVRVGGAHIHQLGQPTEEQYRILSLLGLPSDSSHWGEIAV